MPNEFSPTNPLQFSLTDPRAFLDILASRAAASGVPMGTGQKRVKASPVPAAPPATPTAAPAKGKTTPKQTLPTNAADRLKAAKAAVEQARMADLTRLQTLAQQGYEIDPLTERRVMERYQNRMRGIVAEENLLQRQGLYKQQIRDRVSENKAKKLERGVARAGAKTVPQSTPSPETTQDTSIENPEQVPVSVPSAPAPALAPVSAPVPVPVTAAPPASASVALEQAIAQSPTGQLNSLANNAPGYPSYRDDYGAQQPLDQLLGGLSPEQRAMVQSQMTANNPYGYQQSIGGGVPVKREPEGFGTTLGRASDDAVRGVENFLSSLPFGQSTFAPGGILGAPLPPDLAQRAVDRAMTPNERAMAQAQQTQGAMQGAIQDMIGFGAGAGSRSIPSGATKQTTINEGPVLQGRTPNVAESARPSPTYRFNDLTAQQQGDLAALSEWGSRSVPSSPPLTGPNPQPSVGMLPPNMNRGVLNVTPGNQGQIRDLPVIQEPVVRAPSLVDSVRPNMPVDVVPSLAPIGLISKPYPRTQTTPDGQGLLPGISTADAPALRPYESPVPPVNEIPMPEINEILGQLIFPSNLSQLKPVRPPVVPAAVEKTRFAARQARQGRLAQEQMARQMSPAEAPPTTPSPSKFNFTEGLKRGAKGLIEGYKSGVAERKKKEEAAKLAKEKAKTGSEVK